jgi:predicted MFS family arabinose efflux permease
MNPQESRAAFSLAGIFALRMLGLFLILPVFSIYAEELEGVTPLLVGTAIGAYGLTQALLQIPFGMLSDRIGRKPVIIIGLAIFAIGSAVAASADTIWGVILGRTLQGSGAIAAAVMALAADLSREEYRTRVMAAIGISIGMAFAVSLILGPVLNSWVGVPGIFWLTALLALGGIAVTLFLVPDPKESHFHRDAEPVPAQFGQVLSNLNLLRLDFGVMVLHMTMTALFISMPLVLRDYLGIESASHWMLYLPVLLVSMVLMVPFIVIAERRRKMKQVLLGAILALALAQMGLYVWPHSLFGLASMLLLFFVAFNLLEATLPSLVAKVAKPESKGTAMGVYSTSQFLGAFAGGLLGGWVLGGYGLEGVFLFGAAAVLIWFLFASGMAQPTYLTNHLLRVGELSPTQAAELQMELRDIKGVGEVTVVAEDGVAYLKIDKKEIDMAALDAFSVADE